MVVEIQQDPEWTIIRQVFVFKEPSQQRMRDFWEDLGALVRTYTDGNPIGESIWTTEPEIILKEWQDGVEGGAT